MILTKYADYSIRVLLYLGARPGEKVPITAIADAYDISRNHLMKISQNLARHGFIIGYRGKGGGITLARPSRTIVLGQVLELIEPNLRRVDKAEWPAVHAGDSRFRDALEQARGAFIETLSTFTLADLLGVGGSTGGDHEQPRANGTYND